MFGMTIIPNMLYLFDFTHLRAANRFPLRLKML